MVDKMVWESLQGYSNQCGTIDLTKSEKDRGAFLSTLCSMVKISIDMDNLLVPLLPDTPISVCQMRKYLKLYVRVEF